MTDPDIAYPEQHIQELVKTINTLRAERDEARRELCRHVFLNGGVPPRQYAQAMNWDCFKDEP